MELPSHRVIDNTLSQSAYSYLDGGGATPLDPAARSCFTTFVDGYVNAGRLFSVLPSIEQGLGDPFVELWLRAATPLQQAGAPSPQWQVREDVVLDRFVQSAHDRPAEWAGWTAFQLTPAIALQFKSRVVDWREQLAEALATVRAHTSVLATRREPRLVGFRDDHLARALTAAAGTAGASIDREYLQAARRAGVDIATYALAYAYNWFRRGTSYGFRVLGLWSRFHPLRDEAAVLPGAGADPVPSTSLEIRWGDIVDGYLDVGEMSRDPELVADVLRGLREAVQHDRRIQFASRLDALHEPGLPLTARREGVRDAVLDVLLSNHLPPMFRAGTRRGQLAGSLAATLAEQTGVGELAAAFAGEVVRLTLTSRRARVVEVRVRRRLRHRSLWKVFVIPNQ